jgi:hypothetical protein
VETKSFGPEAAVVDAVVAETWADTAVVAAGADVASVDNDCVAAGVAVLAPEEPHAAISITVAITASDWPNTCLRALRRISGHQPTCPNRAICAIYAGRPLYALRRRCTRRSDRSCESRRGEVLEFAGMRWVALARVDGRDPRRATDSVPDCRRPSVASGTAVGGSVPTVGTRILPPAAWHVRR